MVHDPAAIAHFSPWSWDVEADVIWCLPGLIVMHGQPWPPDAVDETHGRSGSAGAVAGDVPANASVSASASSAMRFWSPASAARSATPIAVGDAIRWLLLQAAVGESEQGRVRRVLGYVRNVTADKLLELRQDQTMRDLEQQQLVLERIAAGDPLEETLELLCRHIERVYPGVFCATMLHDQEAGVLRSGVAPSLSRDYSAATDGLAVGDGNGACGTAAATGEVTVIEDVRTDPRAALAGELFETYGLRSMWSYPLRSVTGVVLGTLALYRSEPFSPPESEIRAVGSIAHLAALAIERDGIHTAIQMSANVYPATGLLNRSSFQELLASRLAEPLRHTALLVRRVRSTQVPR